MSKLALIGKGKAVFRVCGGELSEMRVEKVVWSEMLAGFTSKEFRLHAINVRSYGGVCGGKWQVKFIFQRQNSSSGLEDRLHWEKTSEETNNRC